MHADEPFPICNAGGMACAHPLSTRRLGVDVWDTPASRECDCADPAASPEPA